MGLSLRYQTCAGFISSMKSITILSVFLLTTSALASSGNPFFDAVDKNGDGCLDDQEITDGLSVLGVGALGDCITNEMVLKLTGGEEAQKKYDAGTIETVDDAFEGLRNSGLPSELDKAVESEVNPDGDQSITDEEQENFINKLEG